MIQSFLALPACKANEKNDRHQAQTAAQTLHVIFFCVSRVHTHNKVFGFQGEPQQCSVFVRPTHVQMHQRVIRYILLHSVPAPPGLEFSLRISAYSMAPPCSDSMFAVDPSLFELPR